MNVNQYYASVCAFYQDVPVEYGHESNERDRSEGSSQFWKDGRL